MDASPEAQTITQRLAAPLAESGFWLKLLGVLLIANGVMTALTIMGLIIAWLPIWMGVLLFQAAGALASAHKSGDEATMLRAQQRLRTFFTISGVLVLIMLLLWLAAMVLGFGGMMFTGSMGTHSGMPM